MKAAALLVVVACSSKSAEPQQDPPAPEPIDAARRFSFADLASTATEIGTADPLESVQIDPHGRWVLACQQRGRDHAWYFALGGGAGSRLDEVVAISGTGDHLVAKVDQTLSLLDIAHATITPLPATATVAAFSGDGKALVYVDPPRLVRRDLATTTTTAMDLPAGVVGHLDVDTGGQSVLVQIVQRDEDGNGTLEFNYYMYPTDHRCPLRDASLRADHADLLWADLYTRTVMPEDLRIVRVAAGHTWMKEAQRLYLDGKPIGPADCDSLKVLGIVESPPEALIACGREKGKSPVMLVGAKRTLGQLPHEVVAFDSAIAPMIVGPVACISDEVDRDTCFAIANGKQSKRPRPRSAIGVHDGDWWLARDDRGRLLVGPPAATHGPLHWRAATSP
ncbi:MAG: hypothetical protein ABI867_12535 [Kofleriaceae bacterium]